MYEEENKMYEKNLMNIARAHLAFYAETPDEEITTFITEDGDAVACCEVGDVEYYVTFGAEIVAERRIKGSSCWVTETLYEAPYN